MCDECRASLRQTCECSRTGSIQEVHKEMSLNGGSAKFKSRIYYFCWLQNFRIVLPVCANAKI